jgi:predicted Zn-dependent protease
MLNSKAKRRITILVVLFVGGCVLLGGLWAARKYQIRRQYARFRVDGLAAVERGDNQSALEPLRKYLGRYPSDVEVLVGYAHARQAIELPRRAHLGQAIQILQHVLRLDPSRTAQRRELLALYVGAGLAPEALDMADSLLKLDPDDVPSLRARAAALMGQRKFPEALATAQHWAEVDKNNVQAHLFVAGVLQASKGQAAALEYAQSLHEKKISEPAAQLVEALGMLQANRPNEARPLLQKVAASHPTDTTLVLTLADAMGRLGMVREGLEVLRGAGNDSEVRQHLLRQIWQSGDMQGYIDLVPSAAAAPASRRAEELALKIVSLRRLQKQDQAQALADELKRNAGELEAGWLAALDTLQGAPLSQADATRVHDACRAALPSDPSNPFLIQCLADASRVLGEQDQALQMFTQLADRYPGWLLPILRVAEMQMARGKIDQALDAAGVGFSRAPQNVRMAAVLAVVWDAAVQRGVRRDAQQLLSFVQEIQQSIPGEELSLGVYVRQLAAAGQIEQAKAAMLKAVTDTSEHPSEASLLGWAQLSRELKLGLEDQCLTRCVALHGLTPQIAFLQAFLLFDAGKADEGLQSLRARIAESHAPGASSAAWELVEARYLDLMQSPQALAAWSRLSDAHETDLLVQQAVLSSPEARKDRDLQARSIDRLRRISGQDNPAWRLARARWLVSGSLNDVDAQQAAALLTDVVKNAPDSLEGRFLLARCFERLNKLPQAIEQLNAAAQLSPDSRSIQLFLAELLQRRGDYVEARKLLDRVAGGEFQNPEERRRAAILLAQQGDSGAAMSLLEQGKDSSRDAELLMADLSLQNNDLEQAAALSAKLMQSPDIKTIAIAAEIYAALGRMSEAQAVLAKLDTLDIDPAAREEVRARFMMKHGSGPEAVARLQSAAEASPKNSAAWQSLIATTLFQSGPAAAMQALDEALKHLPDDPGLKALQQRRPLIEALAARGFLPLALGLANASAPDQDAMLDAATTLTRDGADNPAQALLDLSQLGRRYPRSLVVQATVIDRYLALNRPREAASLASAAVQAFPTSPQPARQAVAAFAAVENWAQAAAMARIWRQRSGGDTIEADDAYAAMVSRMGQPELGAAALQTYTDRAADRPGDFARPVAQRALLLYQANKPADAEALLQPLLGKPPIFQAWADAATGLPKELAAAWMERLAAMSDHSIAADMRLAISRAVIADRYSETAQAAAAKAGFTAVAARPDASPQDQLTAAIYLESLGDSAAAEPIYRRLAALGASQAIAMNNLAMILARRDELPAALEMATAAVKAAPRESNLLDTLAFVQRRARNYDAAIASLRDAVKYDPFKFHWRMSLLEVLLDAGASKDAAAELKALNDLFPNQQQLPEPLRNRLIAAQARLTQSAAVPISAPQDVSSTSLAPAAP